MSTSTTLTYDWRKAASANVADDYAVEKAFMDQAHSAVQNKCGPLMQPPHQIGFEIVHKNDSATRMVGIFGFRAGRQLFYAPVFFLNGEIKGSDLLYRHLTKTFVPLSEEWVIYLIANARNEIGRGIDKNETRQLPIRIDLDTLAYPPDVTAGGYKSGSAQKEAVVKQKGDKWVLVSHEGKTLGTHDTPEDAYKQEYAIQKSQERAKKADTDALWESWLDEMDELETSVRGKSAAQLVEHAIERPGLKDYVIAGGAAAVEKLASLMEASLPFANELVRNCTADTWMPEELLTQAQSAAEKRASEAGTEETVLALRFGGEAHPALFKHGFVIDDKREKSQLNPVYVEAEEQLTRGSEPGIWDVLLPDGDREKMFVFYESPSYEIGRQPGEYGEYSTPEPCSNCDGDQNRRPMVVVRAAGNKASTTAHAGNIWGEQLETGSGLLASAALVSTMETGKAYRAIDHDTMEASRPFVVRAKSTRDGIAEYKIRTHGWDQDRVIVVNPDAPRNEISKGTFNELARFVPVGLRRFEKERPSGNIPVTETEGDHYDLRFENDILLGSEEAVDVWVRANSPVKKASLRVDQNLGEWTLYYDKETIRGLSKVGAAVALTKGLRMDADSAFEMLERGEASGRQDFLLWPKQAAQLRLADRENFQTYTDPDFGIPVFPDQMQMLETVWNGPQAPEMRVGDAWDPTMGTNAENADGLGDDALLHLRPEEIAQMSEQGSTPAVFEHGVIGSLVHTFDANTLVRQYMPKLEDAVDALGRTLFLFYWKPTDFEQAYGADDMSQLENQIASSFQSLGKVLLELLKRSDVNGPVNRAAEQN